MEKHTLIGVVGPCASGKSTLVANLVNRGFCARNIAQEHSYVPAMWQRITKPDVLIYLDVSFENTIKRRALDWTEGEYQEQLLRLLNSRQHADICVDTNPLDQNQVLEGILSWLRFVGIADDTNDPGTTEVALP